jgi:hypothetical protein
MIARRCYVQPVCLSASSPIRSVFFCDDFLAGRSRTGAPLCRPTDYGIFFFSGEGAMKSRVGLFGFGRSVEMVFFDSKEARLEKVVRRSYKLKNRGAPEFLEVETDETDALSLQVKKGDLEPNHEETEEINGAESDL